MIFLDAVTSRDRRGWAPSRKRLGYIFIGRAQVSAARRKAKIALIGKAKSLFEREGLGVRA